MADFYSGTTPSPISTARRVVAVTPHNSNDLTNVAKALYVGTAGNVEVLAAGDSAAVVFTAVPAGAILPVQVKRVLATNTTASNIVALYD